MLSVEKPGSPEEILEHHGVKGMRWGVRSSVAKSVGSKAKSVAKAVGKGLDNTIFEFGAHSQHTQNAIVSNASKNLRKDLPNIKARHGNYGKLRNRARHPFSPEAKAYRADVKKTYLKHLEESANSLTNVRGTRQYTLSENGKPNTSQYTWRVSTQSVSHATDGTFTVRPIFDDEGYIIDLEIINDSIAQSDTHGYSMTSAQKPGSPEEILEHVGVLGMKWGHRKTQATREFQRKNPTRKLQNQAIKRARANQMARRAKIRGEPRGSVARANLKKTFLNHPDRATSLRMTTGEKVVVGLIAATPGSNIPLAIGLASRVGARRGLETKLGKG